MASSHREQKGEWLKRGVVVLLLGWACSWSAVAAPSLTAYGFNDDREGVEDLLQLIADNSEEASLRYRQLLKWLDDEQYEVRESATVELANLPVLDRDALKRVKALASPEAAIRIERALSVNTSKRYEDMIRAALETIIDEEMKGLAPLLFRALGKATHFTEGVTWDRAAEALRVTSTAEHLPELIEAFKSRAAIVRASAATAVIHVSGEDAAELLLPLIDDPDDNVKWMAAKALVEVGRAECLPPLVDLLMSEKFRLRWRALHELRQITGQRFEFFSASNKGEREGPAAKWAAWVRDEAPQAELTFRHLANPKGKPLSLFDGKSLAGWEERMDGPPHDRPERLATFSSWSVEDNIVECTGLHPGVLSSEELFENYVLTLHYKIHDRGESGVGLFVGDPDDGYLEVQLKHGQTGELFLMGDLEISKEDGTPLTFRARRFGESKEKKGEWNALEVRVEDGAVTVKVNGIERNRVFGAPRGEMGILLRDEGSAVAFRDIEIRKL